MGKGFIAFTGRDLQQGIHTIEGVSFYVGEREQIDLGIGVSYQYVFRFPRHVTGRFLKRLAGDLRCSIYLNDEECRGRLIAA